MVTIHFAMDRLPMFSLSKIETYVMAASPTHSTQHPDCDEQKNFQPLNFSTVIAQEE
jgi:hypothetical protein